MPELTQNDLAFLTSEPLQGEVLADRMAKGPLETADALQYAVSVGSILHLAHTAGRVHGAVSPRLVVVAGEAANLIAPPEGHPGEITPYTAPEQIRGAPPDPRTDIFAWGALLYEMVAGWPAFTGESVEKLTAAILELQPPPVSHLLTGRVPAAALGALSSLDAMIAGCLEKEPDKRRQRIQNAVIELKLIARPLSRPAAGPVPGLRRQGIMGTTPGLAGRPRLTRPGVGAGPPLARPTALPADPFATILAKAPSAPLAEPVAPPPAELPADPFATILAKAPSAPLAEPVAPPPAALPADPFATILAKAPSAPLAEPVAPPPAELPADPFATILAKAPSAPFAEPVPPPPAELPADPLATILAKAPMAPLEEPVPPPPAELPADPFATILAQAPSAPLAEPVVPPPAELPADPFATILAQAPMAPLEEPVPPSAKADPFATRQLKTPPLPVAEPFLPKVSEPSAGSFASLRASAPSTLVGEPVVRPAPKADPFAAIRAKTARAATRKPVVREEHEQILAPVPAAQRSGVAEPPAQETAPPLAGFLPVASEPAKPPLQVSDVRPQVVEPRVGELPMHLAPELDEEFVRAAEQLPQSANAQAAVEPPLPEVPPPDVPLHQEIRALDRAQMEERSKQQERARNAEWIRHEESEAAQAEAVPAPMPMPRMRTRVPVEPSPIPEMAGLRRVQPGQVNYPAGIRMRFWTIAAAMLLLAVCAGLVVLYLTQRPTPRVLKFAIPPPEHTSYPGTPTVSPDGRYLSFSAIGPEGQRMLWLRPLDSLHAAAIAGTEGAFAPFWSPDSQFIAFFADKALKKVRISGGVPQLICAAEGLAGGGAWNRDDVILFSPSMASPLYRVPADGGTPVAATALDEGKRVRGHLWPQFLPDGKHFLFYAFTDFDETSGAYAGKLGDKETRKLLTAETNAVYSGGSANDSSRSVSQQGYLLYIRSDNLVAQAFNASRLQLGSESTKLADNVGSIRSMGLAPVSVSDNGVLVYQAVGKPTRQLTWFDRSGRPLPVPAIEPGDYGPPRISPDGKRAVVGKLPKDGNAADLWVQNSGGGLRKITATSEHEGSPVWSPDGTRLIYFSNQLGNFDLFERDVEGGPVRLLLKNGSAKYPNDWSSDGRWLVFGAVGETETSDLWVLNVAEKRAFALLATVNGEGYGVFSPDMRWLAFQADDTGRVEVYVQRFRPENDGETQRRYQVSTNGGGLPHWRGDGKELFYMSPSGRIMAATVKPSQSEFVFEPPHMLFQTRPVPKTWNLYDAAPDGQRFLVNSPLEWSSASPITVVTNWTEKAKAR